MPGWSAGCATVLVHRGPDGSGYHESPPGRARDAQAGDHRCRRSSSRYTTRTARWRPSSTVRSTTSPSCGATARRGHPLATDGDSECIAHLYEDYGDDLVHRLRGMFALAIWDAARRRLLLARDRVGKNPCTGAADGESLSFGSELKALRSIPASRAGLDLVALHHYLTYQYVPAPWSIYQGSASCHRGTTHLAGRVAETAVTGAAQCTGPSRSPRFRRPRNGCATAARGHQDPAAE